MEARLWDVIVIGAGPAGSMAARCAALSGLETLLIEAKRFPRDKVCGGYLNSRALRILANCDLQTAAEVACRSPVLELRLACERQRATFSLPPGQIVCRRAFDTALLDSARHAGVTVTLQAIATVLPHGGEDFRHIEISQDGVRRTVTAKVVVCADGVGRPSVRRLPEFMTVAQSDSRVGIGAVATGSENAIPPGQLLMTVSPRGYVGIARIGVKEFNIAAAIDPRQLLQGSALCVVRSILRESGIDVRIDLDRATWRGTFPLTSHPCKVAANRVFLIGDAGGYVEPFTGEGMASALETGFAVAPFAAVAVSSWSQFLSEGWASLHHQLVCDRHNTCRQLAWVLRRRWASATAIRLCRFCPSIARYLIARTSC